VVSAMSISTETRDRLAAQQASLVSALLAGSLTLSASEGITRQQALAAFDAARLRVAALALSKKRERAVARAWPELAHALGVRFQELFASYAPGTPLRRKGGALADGRAFTRWLAARSELPEAGRLQALAVDLHCCESSEGLVPRRGPALKAAFLRCPRRFVIGLRLPWLGEHWLTILLGQRSG